MSNTRACLVHVHRHRPSQCRQQAPGATLCSTAWRVERHACDTATLCTYDQRVPRRQLHGVTPHGVRDNLQVQTSLVFLGSFQSPQLAARAHDVAVLLCSGDRATLNFPEQDYHEVPHIRKRWPDRRLLHKAVCSANKEHLRVRFAHTSL